MAVFGRYLSLFIPVVYLCVFFLRYFSLEFVYDDTATLWTRMDQTAILATVMASMVAVVVYFITRPFDRVVTRIKKEQSEATPEEVSRCLMCYKQLNVVTLVTCILGFIVGQIIMITIGVLNGRNAFQLSRIMMIMGQATGFGIICATLLTNGLNVQLAPMRRLLKVRSLDSLQKQRSMSLSWTLTIIIAGLIFFMAANMYSVPYGLFYKMHNNLPLPADPLGVYLKKGALCFFLSLLFCLPPVWFVIRGFDSRVKETIHLVDDIAEKGDLRSRINVTILDDFGLLTASMNKLMVQFSSIITEIKNGASAVSGSADSISSTVHNASSELTAMNETFAHITETAARQQELIGKTGESLESLVSDSETVKKHVLEQASSIQQTSASVSEMTTNISSVAEIAVKAAEVSQHLTETSVQGKNAVIQAVGRMKEIQVSSAEVRDMVTIIQKLASQTNLLAMNAAIEAAHAGEFGKGFAVVADEVRTLANSSAKSTKEIQQHIKDMITKIDGGVEAITSAGESFNGISQKVDENAQLVHSISSAMEAQRTNAEETMKSTTEVVGAVQAIKELAEKESANAQNVNASMQRVVEASQTVAAAVQTSVGAATNLQKSVERVDDSAVGNKDTVGKMQNMVNNFLV
jgi:methyl-accepting chemotaxis protein